MFKSRILALLLLLICFAFFSGCGAKPGEKDLAGGVLVSLESTENWYSGKQVRDVRSIGDNFILVEKGTSGDHDFYLDHPSFNGMKQKRESPGDSTFNLIFKYGVDAKNILNTFEGTYTKDMIPDPPIATKLSLTREELDTIYKKMVDIDFFSYPDVFTIPVKDEYVGMITPYQSYYFKVQHGSGIKELSWEDSITNQNNDADRLRELTKCIREIAESKNEYKKLPPPRGGYE